MSLKTIYLLCIFTLFSLLIVQCDRDSSSALSPQEELASFELAGDLNIELVAAEPQVQDPVFMTFDEKGQLWVVEMRGFMPNVDRIGEEKPIGRISTLIDQDLDGVMDSSVVFADSLVLPRSLAITSAGVLVAENIPLWLMKDNDGDGVSDERILIDAKYGGLGLVEHAPNGLWRGIDNWYYNAKSSIRYKFVGDKLISDTTEFRGQWGISHDDEGRLFYNYNWSQLHADLVPPNYFSANPNHTSSSGLDHGVTLERQIFPIRDNMIANRGYIPEVLDQNGRLQEFSAACAPFVYRGDLLAKPYRGNVFVCDPSGNLIRRNIISENGLYVSASNGEQRKEFLASTDERFRPVFMTTGPDGALYIADMYKGIIQHGLYMSEYLRKMVLDHELDVPINMGRIWRVTPKNATSIAVLNIGNGQGALEALHHENGMIRDQAQRILVESGDMTIIPDLAGVITGNASPYVKIHALWTLSGLGHTDTDIYLTALKDKSAVVVSNALRIICEDAAAEIPERVLYDHLSTLSTSNAIKVRLAVALSARKLSAINRIELLVKMISQDHEDAVMRDAVLSGLEGLEFDFATYLCNDQNWQENSTGKDIFLENTGQAIANSQNPNHLAYLLSETFRNKVSDWRYSSLMRGLANFGDTAVIVLKQQPWFLQPNQDPGLGQEQQSIGEFISWPGEKRIERTKNEFESGFDRNQLALGRRQYLTTCSSCHGLRGEGIKRYAPPLSNSEWVDGDEQILIRIMLHGMHGEVTVNGVNYGVPEIQPVMPSFASMQSRELAAILTYIRFKWGQGALPISPGLISNLRIRTQGRTIPWTQEELLNLDLSKD